MYKLYSLQFIFHKNFLAYVFCAINDDINLELIQLTHMQHHILNMLCMDIYPKYTLTTYLIDPFNQNKCYLFIENTVSNEIKHYTVAMNDKISLEFVKQNILNIYSNINETFDFWFFDKLNILDEIFFLKNKTFSIAFYKFNMILKRFIDMNGFFMFRLDKFDIYNFYNKVNLSDYYRSPTKYISNILRDFLIMGEELKKKINLYFFDLGYNVCKKNLETFICNKILGSYDYNLNDLKLQIKQITKIARYSYFFCIRYNIDAKYMMTFILKKIRLMINKLSKLTFILCFIKIYSNENELYNRAKILKIIIFMFAYYKHSYINLNNMESLYLLYNISRKSEPKGMVLSVYKEMFTGKNVEIISFKKIIIKRYIFFLFSYEKTFLHKITSLFNHSEYLEKIWIIVKCCLITIYKIFDIDF